MKIVEYTRVSKPNSKILCTMEFEQGQVILDFGKKHGGKLELGMDFLADSVEYYLSHIIKLKLEEKCRSRKARRKKL